MKKKVKRIIAIVLSCMTVSCMTACNWKWENTDGEFIYKYKNSPNYGPCYSITGSTEEGKKYKENVYVPTHFNGLPVYYTFTSYTGNGGALGTNTMEVNCKNLYFNCIQKYDFIFRGTVEYIFIPTIIIPWGGSVLDVALKTSSNTVYLSEQMYEYTREEALTSPNAHRFQEINRYQLIRTIKNELGDISNITYVIKANAMYHFNYENSPNVDCFFINDFEWGGLIEDTPYKPFREGYTFGGWYKEPKCENVWDFQEDRLPTATYNEEGYVTNHTVTHLYAKWTKE